MTKTTGPRLRPPVRGSNHRTETFLSLFVAVLHSRVVVLSLPPLLSRYPTTHTTPPPLRRLQRLLPPSSKTRKGVCFVIGKPYRVSSLLLV
ncbi:hypothetical protein Hanom_Chr15g01407271 [Helianthus anomalus]